MSRKPKIGRNDTCPCLSGLKFKHCCKGKIDWQGLLNDDADPRPYLSVRGRNLVFRDRIAEILQLDSLPEADTLTQYKSAFTARAVREIHEAILDIWPKDLDIATALSTRRSDVSGLYVGDYDIRHLHRAVVRHSTYASKILIVDPFIYPLSVRDEYNPILNPEQYRAQTLKNVNFYLALAPWLDAGIVEIIRGPTDFDADLRWNLFNSTKHKYETIDELKAALELTSEDMKKRHFEESALQMLILSAPDDYLRMTFEQIPTPEGASVEDFIRYVNRLRDRDPNFLEPLGQGNSHGQLHMTTSGASYEEAKILASLTNSYIVTDLASRWKEIELDRTDVNAVNQAWAPFAKAIQETQLRYFDGLQLSHALRLRQEGRLEGLRVFMHKVWGEAVRGSPYDEANAVLLAHELIDEVKKAEQEWKQINYDLVKIMGSELTVGLLAAGPLIQAGFGSFLAAAAIPGLITPLILTKHKKKVFPDKYPAAFFLNVDKQT